MTAPALGSPSETREAWLAQRESTAQACSDLADGLREIAALIEREIESLAVRFQPLARVQIAHFQLEADRVNQARDEVLTDPDYIEILSVTRR